MAYIGNKPANKAIVASDLDPAVITGQTALAEAPASTDEFLISDAGTLKRLDASFIGGTNTPAFHAYLNSNQSISSSTETKVALDAEALDTDSAFASNKFTVPSGKAGKYYIEGRVTLGDTSGGTSNVGFSFVTLHKNGSNVGGDSRHDPRANNGSAFSITIQAILDLSAGDYIELFGSGQISTSPHFFGASGAVTRTYLLGFKLIT